MRITWLTFSAGVSQLIWVYMLGQEHAVFVKVWDALADFVSLFFIFFFIFISPFPSVLGDGTTSIY